MWILRVTNKTTKESGYYSSKSHCRVLVPKEQADTIPESKIREQLDKVHRGFGIKYFDIEKVWVGKTSKAA